MKIFDFFSFKTEIENYELRRKMADDLEKEQMAIIDKAIVENRGFTETEQMKLDIIRLKISDIYRR